MSSPTIPLFRYIASAVCAVFVAPPAAAETGDEASESDGAGYREVIIVTAEKREESILDVPLTVTGFNSDMLEELGMTRTDDLEQLVPGLQFGETFSKFGHGTVIRGMGTLNNGPLQGNSAVATYVDGVYHTTQIGITDGFFDVERVEVARGPQGTLNGRNSIAGAITVISKKPTDEWDADILAEWTDQFSQRYGVAFGGPISDAFAFRVTGTYHDGEGAQENVGSGPDYDAPHSWGIKPQFRFKTDRVDVIVSYNQFEDTGATRVPLLLRQPPTDRATVCFSWRDPLDPRYRDPNDPLFICNESGNNYAWYLYDERVPSVENCPPNTPANRCDSIQNKVRANRPAIEDTSRDGWAANADLDVTENLTFRYTYGSTKLDQFSSNDNDWTDRVPSEAGPPQDCIDSRGVEECLMLFAGGGASDGRIIYPYTNDERSHEVQLISNFDGPLNFIVGAYDYIGSSTWNDGGHSFGLPWRFGTADSKAQALGFADCEDFFAAVVEPRIGEFTEEDPFRRVVCPPSDQDDFTNRWGSGSASDQITQAVFASFDYQFNPQWAVSGGARYTEDQNIQTEGSDFYYSGFCPPGDAACREQGMHVPIYFPLDITESQAAIPDSAPEGCDTNCLGLEQQWDAIIWNANIEYTPRDNTLIYGRISTGYRAGGLPSPTASFLPPIEEETVINYEAGVKGLFLEDKLLLTVGGFLNNYDGYQVNALMDAVEAGFPQTVSPYSSSPLQEFTTNVDGTSIWGLDLEWTYYLSEQWRIGGYYAFLDSSLGEFSTVVIDDPDPEVGVWHRLDWDTGEPTTRNYIKPRNLKDGKLPQQAKHKAAVSVSYDKELDGGRGSVQLLGTWSYTGDRYALVQNAESNRMPAYSRLDLRAAWTSANTAWSATVYVQNALDEIGFVEYIPGFRPDWAFNASEGYAKGTLTEPRQFGLQVRWRPQR